MNRILFILLAFAMSANMLMAQGGKHSDNEYSDAAIEYPASDYYPFGVGLAFAFKGGVNTLDSPKGVKNGYVFTSMPDIGAQVFVPFGTDNNLGFLLDLAYVSYPYKFKLYGDEDVNWVDKLSYFTIAPNFHISGFIFGVNIGIPMAAESDNATTTGNTYTYLYAKESMKTMIDIHIGALIPLVKTNFGRLNLLIQGEYALSDAFSPDLLTMNKFQKFNIQPAAIKFGLSYIFNTELLQR